MVTRVAMRANNVVPHRGGEGLVSAKQACRRTGFVFACCLALLQAEPAPAQSSAKRKPEANPVSVFFQRLTTSPPAKKPSAKPKKAVAAKPPVPPAKPAAAPDSAAATNPFVPEPRPAPQPETAPEASGASRTATVVLGPSAEHAVQSTPAPQPAAPSPARIGRGDRLPAAAGAAAVAAATAPSPAPDKARLLAAEPVKMAKDAWAPQTRAAMFAAEPSFAAAVFPTLGSRLAAVAPIELRTPAATNPSPAARGAAASDIPLPRPAPPEGEVKLASLPTPEPPEPEEACINLLAAGVESTPADALAGEGDCGARFPVKVVAFHTDEGRVTLDPPAVMRCGMARATAKWLKENVAPTAKAKLGSELRSVRTASSYVCRPRNGVAGAKMSEHGRANALDISAFVLGNGKAITVGAEGSEDLTAFTKEVRTAACVYVHTVLGPGSDAAHSGHLHLDMAQRGRNGDARFCQ